VQPKLQSAPSQVERHLEDTVPSSILLVFLPLSSSLESLSSFFCSAASSVLARGFTTTRRLCLILLTSALAIARVELDLRRTRLLLADLSRDLPRGEGNALLHGALCLSVSLPLTRRRRRGTAELLVSSSSLPTFPAMDSSDRGESAVLPALRTLATSPADLTDGPGRFCAQTPATISNRFLHFCLNFL
jgi:hypothetical protein